MPEHTPAPVPVEETRDGDGEFVVEPVPYVLRPGPVMTNSAVRIRHEPTGIAVICDEHKSQLANKDEALRRLRLILAAASPPPVGDGRRGQMLGRDLLLGEIDTLQGAREARGDSATYVEALNDVRDVINHFAAPSPVQGGGVRKLDHDHFGLLNALDLLLAEFARTGVIDDEGSMATVRNAVGWFEQVAGRRHEFHDVLIDGVTYDESEANRG